MASALAPAVNAESLDLMELSLEELCNIEVTSVSKRAQKLSESAAAVFVITQEDLKRSGVTNIPDALRMAPGIQVAQIDANVWAVSARGFNDRFANKMLVLIDGRSVYTPLFSGTYWDSQNLLMEDIDRIEIIRGPGATMWGANAVNGVINVITKDATDTQGGMLALGLGEEERGYAAFRGSGVLGDDAHYRVHGRFLSRDNFEDRLGNPGADSWETVHGGFRLDWAPQPRDRVSLQGAIYRGNMGERAVFPTLEPPYTITREGGQFTAGGHLFSRWNRQYGDGSELRVQSYFDRTVRDSERILREARNTIDLDAMHRFFLGGRQEVSWGFGYRSTWDDLQNSASVAFLPDERVDHLFSSFVHEKITLKEDQAYVSFGAKFEHNSYTGFEIQPNARVWWRIGSSQSLWGAVSRAVRTPSRAEADIRVPQEVLPPGAVGLPDPVVLVVTGSDDFESEELLAYEAGYRSHPLRWLSLDIAGFYNRYENLRTHEPGPMMLDSWDGEDVLTIPFVTENNMRGKTRGLETVAEFRVSDQWRITGVYSYLDISLELVNGSLDPVSLGAEEQSPTHQLAFRSSMDITRTVALDLGLRHVGEVPAASVDAYTVMDFRIGWEASPGLDLGLVGRNLLKNHHAEFRSTIINTVPTEVQPSIFGTLAWHFE